MFLFYAVNIALGFCLLVAIVVRLVPHLEMRYKCDLHATESSFLTRSRRPAKTFLVMTFYLALMLSLLAFVAVALAWFRKGQHHALHEALIFAPYIVLVSIGCGSDYFFRELKQEAEGTETMMQMLVWRVSAIERRLAEDSLGNGQHAKGTP